MIRSSNTFRLIITAVTVMLLASCWQTNRKNVSESNPKPIMEGIIIHIRYTGENGSARAFAKEMIESGTVDAIRAEEGNLKYEYSYPEDDPESVVLTDIWASQEALDIHHATQMMETIAALREKYNLHMTVEREGGVQDSDAKFIRK
jgi:quinol monooxygenase YgiN